MRATLAAAALLPALLLAAPGAGARPAEDLSLRIGGSTTLLPMVANAASTFMEKHETWNKVDASLPEQPVIVYVTGGGSSFGVKSAIDGTVHIGMASRDLKDKEKSKLGEHRTHLVGKDCVAIAVNRDNPLAKAKKDFTVAEAAKLFAGDYATYKDLDPSLPAEEIVLLVRDAGAGSAEILQKEVLKDRTVSPKALQMPSQGALLKKLESNARAVAYMSSGLVNESDALVAFSLEGVAPTNANVIAGKYLLSRPLLLVVKGEPDLRARKFIEFVLGPEGQRMVRDAGYVPARSPE
jgi:phosphate transport system substrate-binding protein